MYESLNRLAKVPDTTRVYCGHEYTLSNIRFAKAAEPGNQTLAALEQRAIKQLEQGKPTVPTEMGEEKQANPFLRVDQPEIVANASRHAGQPLNDPVSVLAALRDWKNNF